MYFTGISDEAGRAIDTQIKAHQTLGWKHLELRAIDQFNLGSLPHPQYREMVEKLKAADLQVSCFSSGIANWAKKITSDFNLDLFELNAAIPRLHELGTKFVRIMSYPNDNWAQDVWFREVVRRLSILAKIAEDQGLILVHENCSGWGGDSPENTLRMLEAVASPALKLVLDTGNPPSEGQYAWDFYSRVKEHIVYIHIKDATQKQPDGKTDFTFPGEGAGAVKKIVTDLLASGYQGGFSIEPHLAAIIHLAQEADNPNAQYDVYVEYGRRLIQLVAECQNSRR